MATPGKPPSSPSSPSGGGGGGGGDGGEDDDDEGGPLDDVQSPADVEGNAGTFAGVPLWQWIALAGALLWTRKG